MQALWISCLFGLCLVPFGFSRECYECLPGLRDGALDFCSKPANKTTCIFADDDCLTVSYKVKSGDVELAGNIMMCGMGACEATGSQGCENARQMQAEGATVSDCQHKCCKGDLCNDRSLYAQSGGERGVAHFGAIFAALMLCRFLM